MHEPIMPDPDHPDACQFRLYIGVEDDPRAGLRMKYRTVEVMAIWDDDEESEKDLLNLMRQFLTIYKEAKKERAIVDQVRAMDAELDELLGNDE